MPDGRAQPAHGLTGAGIRSRANYEKVELPPYSLWETRQGSGTPVVLLHGLAGSSRWWSRNLAALAAEHTVAAVDLVGFGRNRTFAGLPYILPPFGEVTALLARWIERFGEPVHLMGHSMGGHLAIRLAAERPELVRSLVLVNAAGVRFRIDPLAHLRPLRHAPYGGPGIARVLVPDFFRAGPTSVAVALTRVVFGEAGSAMKAVHAPTLLVWGANDPLVPLSYGEEMQREIAGSQLAVIERAAHVAMWDAPEEFNRVALEFLREVEERPRTAPTVAGRFRWGIAGFTNGMAHRESGPRRDVVLVHGLGMASSYFEPLAAALHARGLHAAAPDLPGFGASANGDAAGPGKHAELLASWADAIGVRDAIWVGHSIGCTAVAHLARRRPDLVRGSVLLGPVWTSVTHPSLRLLFMLVLDALREPLQLYRWLVPAYWRAGMIRWWQTWTKYAKEIHDVSVIPEPHLIVSGRRDPVTDRRCVTPVEVSGAHACNVSHAEEVAARVAAVCGARSGNGTDGTNGTDRTRPPGAGTRGRRVAFVPSVPSVP